ncbi:MAG: polar amino acid transport system permease protein [Actinomycetota bacterium]|jgi:polar amino acid transport system permease protein|nr:polar amino acid transport system permease protein [Actinomycetota bacterium]
MTVTGTATSRAEPEAIKAIPVRHPGRWVAVVVIAVLAAMFVHMLVTNHAFQWGFMRDNAFRPPVLEGVRTTVLLTVCSMAIGIALGIVLAVMRLSDNPILRSAAWLFVWFFRAVPRYVLLTLCGNLGILFSQWRFGVPFGSQIASLLGFDSSLTVFGLDSNAIASGFTAGLIGLALSEAAYMAEIVRAGISSIDAGQTEAAQALGMSRGLTTRRIVLPQAMRVIVPPTGNETIAMLKDTSLVVAVPVSIELFFQLEAIGSRTFQIFPMLVAACLWYLALSSLLMIGQYFLERRYSRGFGGERSQAVAVPTVGGNH